MRLATSIVIAAALSGLCSCAAWAEDWDRDARARLLAPNGEPGALCYDAVVTGSQGEYGNSELLMDLLGDAWLGHRANVRIAVEKTLRGRSPRPVIWVRLIETTQHKPGVRRVFVLRRVDDHHYWALDWAYPEDARREGKLSRKSAWLPPRCS